MSSGGNFFDLEQPEPPEVIQLRADGFTPIQELTGSLERAALWPSDHRRDLTDWRYDAEEAQAHFGNSPGITDGVFSMVRSPWPTIDNEQAMALLDRWLRRHRPKMPPGGVRKSLPQEREDEVVLTMTFLSQDEKWVRAFREGHVRATKPI